ncbi:MAG: recombinase RecA, partial [Candidatus Acidiferrales bacterium]
GRENARLFLRENTDIRDKLEAAVRKQLGLGHVGNAQPEPPKPQEKAAAVAATASKSAAPAKR